MGHDMEDCPYRNKIEDLEDKTSNNEYRIGMLENEDWYDNQELFEMIDDVQMELEEFNSQFKKYNGLIEKYHKHEERLSQIEKEREKEKSNKKTKNSIYNNWREWLAWIVAFVLSISKLLEMI